MCGRPTRTFRCSLAQDICQNRRFWRLFRSETQDGIPFAQEELVSYETRHPLKGEEMKRLLILLVAITWSTADATAQKRRGNIGAKSPSQQRNQSRQPQGLLTTNSQDLDLFRMWEEEKLAHDVYTKLAKTSNLSIFRNISRAESKHMQAIERFVRAGGARGDGLSHTPGVFSFPEYQQLYESLVTDGMRSPLEALKVGAKIEEMDIADLRRMLTQTTDPQVRKVLEHLMQGSQNHLRAFASQLARQGASYNAEFLTQAEFDQIANSAGRSPERLSGQKHRQQSAGQKGSYRGSDQPQGLQGQHSGGQRSGGQDSSGRALGPQFQNRQGGRSQAGGKQRRGRGR